MRAVNLLPNDLRSSDRKVKSTSASRAAGSGTGAYAILGGLAAVVVAVAVATALDNGVKQHERELASVQAEQLVAQAENDRLAPYGSFSETASQRLQTVRQLADSRFDWEQALRDLSRALPRDVTLAQLTGTVAPGTTAAGGGGSNPLRAAIQSPAIELSGCTSDQAAVARLMARLRAVRGVTRVSLASSIKSESTSAATTDSAATTAAGGCGKGSPPKFEVVTFFEGVKTAAPSTTATAASATAAATPTPAAGAAATPTPAPASGGQTSPTPTPPAGASPEGSTK